MEIAGSESRTRGSDSASPLTADTLVDMFLERVHRYAAMVSPASTDPDDLTQQAMIRAIEQLHRYDPRRGSLEAWLWTIVHNLARDSGRAIRRRHHLFETLRARREETAESPETLALDHIRDQRLVSAVRSLPARDRTIIALRYGAGLSPTEVADLIGASRMAVAKATRRALDKLRVQLSSPESQT